MGPEHLIRTAAFALLVGCALPREPAPAVPAPQTPHTQVIRAMKTTDRVALVNRFKERNGQGWMVNDAALATSTTVMDPFIGFLRRARTTAEGRPAAVRIGEAAAALPARAFVRKNADLLGVPQNRVLTLGEQVRAVVPDDHASPRAVWAVRFETQFSTRGYEAFPEVENEVDLEVFIDDDGTPSSFVNISKLHTRLAIDTKPALAEDDGRLVAKLIGRRVFALENGAQVELGTIEDTDFVSSKLVIELSSGPFLAWITYRLSRMMIASKAVPGGAGFYFFGWVVDADTGDITRDSPVPTSAMPLP